MSEPPPLSDAEREELVAYLDGELDEEAARAVAARINVDPRVRAEAEALRGTWDLLDYLPRPEPSPSFTHRTLQRVSALRLTQPARRPWRVWQIAAGWAAAVVLATLVGFGGMEAFLARQPTDEDLIRDLRIIENKRLYEPVDDIDFLRKLAQPELFGDDSPGS
ncbi:MAG TPA: hypothetical protein VNK04_12685 [Gemmataceae bacterium]|nr:hypothetical protein [Gemmataceae bacterium]